VALLVGAYFLLYAPALEARTAAIDGAEEVEAANVEARAELAQLAKDQENLEETKLKLAEAQARFPTSWELEEFTDYLRTTAAATGASMTDIGTTSPVQVTIAQPLPLGPDGYQPPTVPQPPAGLYQFRFSITFVGVWSQTQAFLEALQDDDARMFLVVAVSATPDGAPGGVDVAARYEVGGYTYAVVPADKIPTTTEGEAQ
jgi:hypothetical protein